METGDLRCVPRELRAAAVLAWAAGWRIIRTRRNHLQWLPPAGRMIVTASAQSSAEHRSTRNALARLRGAGLRA